MTQMDPSLMERGLAAAPGSVPTFQVRVEVDWTAGMHLDSIKGLCTAGSGCFVREDSLLRGEGPERLADSRQRRS